MRCAECGAEVIMTYERLNTTFCINDKGIIEKHDNNIEGNALIIHCSEDLEHEVRPPYNTKLYKLWLQWEQQVDEDFYDNHLEDIY